MLIDIGFYLGERKGKKDKKEKYAISFIELRGFRGGFVEGVWGFLRIKIDNLGLEW